jgi:hypothetical protein
MMLRKSTERRQAKPRGTAYSTGRPLVRKKSFVELSRKLPVAQLTF